MKTMKELAQEALDVQNACNLSGVAQRFAAVMLELWDHNRAGGEGGTEWVNTHPIAIVWIDKINHLAKIQSYQENAEKSLSAAYDFCFEQTKE